MRHETDNVLHMYSIRPLSSEGVDGSGNRLPVTQCGQQQRTICAEDKCKIVEGEPECYEKTVENVVQVPEEICSLEPTEECRNVTIR